MIEKNYFFLVLIPVLLLGACASTPTPENQNQQMTNFLLSQNEQKMELLTLMRNKLIERGAIVLLEEEINKLNDLDRTLKLIISRKTSENNEDRLENLEETIKDLSLKILENFSNEDFNHTEIYDDPILNLLEDESRLIELARFKLWINFLSEIDNQTYVFATPGETYVENDSMVYYIGVMRRTPIKPTFSTLMGKLSRQEENIAKLKLKKEDLLKSDGEVVVRIPMLSGEMEMKRIKLKNEFVIQK